MNSGQVAEEKVLSESGAVRAVFLQYGIVEYLVLNLQSLVTDLAFPLRIQYQVPCWRAEAGGDLEASSMRCRKGQVMMLVRHEHEKQGAEGEERAAGKIEVKEKDWVIGEEEVMAEEI